MWEVPCCHVPQPLYVSSLDTKSNRDGLNPFVLLLFQPPPLQQSNHCKGDGKTGEKLLLFTRGRGHYRGLGGCWDTEWRSVSAGVDHQVPSASLGQGGWGGF